MYGVRRAYEHRGDLDAAMMSGPFVAIPGAASSLAAALTTAH